MSLNIPQLTKSLVEWYRAHKRDLPWRQNRDPYRIWISETMLQQTTVVAVIPFYEKFLKRFPKVDDLANASLEEVYEYWAGLGYYSRARNLHKSAQILSQNGFPRSFEKLIELPGFGPYTSRAVSSLAFDEAVGVLDGNVIRVLSRVGQFQDAWWTTTGRNHLQKISDQFAQNGHPSEVNQALMELGATICTPQKTMCLLCPWKRNCQALKTNQVQNLPLKKPRKEFENWNWKPVIAIKKDKVLVCKNDYAPFLKNQVLFPGDVKKSKAKPKTFDLKHTITHHSIYIQIDEVKSSEVTLKDFEDKFQELQWVSIKELKKINPSILLGKILSHRRLQS